MVGREKEISDLISLLKKPDIGLITLHGFGGTGKTRLAVEVGRVALEMFPDGVWFVAMAPLNSADYIFTAAAAAMGFTFQSQEDQKSQFLRFLHGKNLLIIFDNLEHLLPASAAYFEEFLQNAPEIRLLVTSRHPINAPWEWVYPLHGLDYETGASIAEGEIPAAVQLFLQHLSRAGAPASDNDPACAAQICQIVRGLPLALLLAASWGRALGCDEIFDEIRRGIGFLHSWQQTFPEKHSSMQAVFDYSWQLLSKEERAALRQLAVFRGGFDRNAAAQVAGADLSLLAHLVDQSLVERVSKDRYQIHELLRQYLHDRLVDAGEEKLTRDQHLAYYTRLSKQAEPELLGKQQRTWLERLRIEIDNLRAALDWSLTHSEATNVERGLRLIACSGRFWKNHAYTKEGYSILVRLLELEPVGLGSESYAYARGHGFNWASSLSFSLEDLPETRRLASEALRIGTELNDPRLIGDAYFNLGREAFFRVESKSARTFLKQALESYQKCGYLHGTIQALTVLGRDESIEGDFSDALSHLSTALDLARKQEDTQSIYQTLRSLGDLTWLDPQGSPQRALAYLEEGLQYAREADDKRVVAFILNSMGEAARLLGEFERAAAVFEEADSISREAGTTEGRIQIQLNLGFVYLRLGNYAECKQLFIDNLRPSQLSEHLKGELTLCLLGLAGVATAEGQAQWAARMLGVIEPHKEEFFLTPTDRSDYERSLASVKAQLTEKQFSQLHKEGQALSLKDAAQLILNQGIKEEGRDVGRLNQLTKREIEILRLVAQGLSDAQVAERLVLSPRTVNAHLTSIYNKLGVNSRSAATRYAIEHGLA